MAWSDPGDFTSGQILTAAQMDSVREAMFFGQATFTDEAARDAAIPATGITLQEGMRAYLTAPTVPAATGGVTSLPSGVTTVYNGSAWVCVTPVSAYTSTSGTRNSATYGALTTGGGTNPTVTVTTGTTALVTVGSNIATGGSNSSGYVGFSVSGATTLAATDGYAIVTYSGAGGVVTQAGFSRTFVIDGLTAGTNTFALQYRTFTSAATFEVRQLTVQGIA